MNSVNLMIWLLVLPLVSSPLIYLAGRLQLRRSGSASLSRWLAVAALLGTAVLLVPLARQAFIRNVVGFTYADISLRMDGIALILAGMVLFLGLMVCLFSFTYMKNEVGEEKFYALLLALVAAIIGLGCAEDLFNLWVWFELMAVSSYLLVAFYREQKASLEAGVKYLVQSAAGSVLVLLGIALVYAHSGSLSMELLALSNFGRQPLLLTAGGLFLIGYGVKTALVPLHTWLPDAHSQAPSGISAMLSGIVIEAGLVALLRSVGCISSTSPLWGVLILGFAAVNIFLGNIMALRQVQIKRLLAYSSVAHMGYMLLGLGIGITFSRGNGSEGAFFHLITHGLMKSLAFLAAGGLLYALHLSRGDHEPLVLDDLNGASRRYPLTALFFSMAALGLGGLPPLAGFMSKWQIFMGAVQTQNPWAIGLVVFAALNSVLSLGYYAPLVNRLYRREPGERVMQGNSLTLWMVLPMLILALLVLLLGIWPAPVRMFTDFAANALAASFGY